MQLSFNMTQLHTFLIITLLKRIRNKSDIQCVENISYKIYVKLYIIIYDVCILDLQLNIIM